VGVGALVDVLATTCWPVGGGAGASWAIASLMPKILMLKQSNKKDLIGPQ